MKSGTKLSLFVLSSVLSFSIVSCGPNIGSVCKNVPLLASCMQVDSFYRIVLHKRQIDSYLYYIEGNDDCSLFLQNAVNYNSWDNKTFGKAKTIDESAMAALYNAPDIRIEWDGDYEPTSCHLIVAEDGVVFLCLRKTYVCSEPGLGNYNYCMEYRK
ncbi:MAG: hypothetical protein MJ238_02240 [Bacilli bacterium]|nr:hypothetical protein [Bacilli bacterium]